MFMPGRLTGYPAAILSPELSVSMRRALIVLALLALSGTLRAQPSPPRFEIADVHRSDSLQVFGGGNGALYGDRFIVRQVSLADLISNAWSIDARNIQGGPSWLELDRYDVIAKTAPRTPTATLKLMLRSLLEERFGVVVHSGVAPMPAYVLLVDGKSKLKAAAGGDPGCDDKTPSPSPDATALRPNLHFACHNKTMDQLASDLVNFAGGYVDKPIVNSTGISGEWDYDLIWTGKGLLARAGADGISIFDALERELGLKLVLQTAPRPVLIVDNAKEIPTPNSAELARLMPPPPPAVFDVAVIKPTAPGDTNMRGQINQNQVKMQSMTLKFLISVAWGLNAGDGDRVVGPKWLDTDRFDILAKIGDSVASAGRGADAPPIDPQQILDMMQALVVDRFQMKYHMEDRPMPAYTLTAVSPKLKPANPAARTRCVEGPGPDGRDPRISNPVLNRLITCSNMTVPQMARKFQEIANGYIQDDVVDNTGLKGAYDFTLSFSSAGTSGAAPPVGDASDPNGALTLFDAVSRQLGLKLAREKRPIPVLVIDRINEKPTEN